MIINGSYLNLLNRLSLPSNDTDVDKTADNNKNNNIDNAKNLPVNMDSTDLSSTAVTEVEAEVITKEENFNWTYNTTDDGYLPDFQLGDWENTSQILFSGNTMQIDERSFAVYLPQALQDKMAEDPEFAKEINDKLQEFFNNTKKTDGTLEDGTEYSVISQHIAVSMNENGDIVHSYVRTESYSVSKNNNDNSLTEKPANDENVGNTSEVNASFTISYGFSIYQQSAVNSSKELTDEEKNSQALIQIGVQSVITIETAQKDSNEPEIKVRKVNGDLVELETGKLIQKHAGYLTNQQKYDSKA